ncbi:hypothetical protein [Tengunoibacter tsumagoiensis]|uniref:Uncharacterized protein n=1 Tax=Tengunoibacter tsumagoiensis TaxID=2014871 RepID=A0A401ZY17_9CHLR|nr:hypothetical protein [Tengunoibacter tsumagoiensis]GCE11737.1 hypothetical protein KTT_15960 [Tengunoibacter tsumagoiensis]
MKTFAWLFWPLLILCSAVAVVAILFTAPGTPLRGAVVMWFLFLCPGMALIRLLGLQNLIMELTMAIAVGIAIDGIVVGIFLYSGHWSIRGILLVLLIWSCTGAFLQLLTPKIPFLQHMSTRA